MVRDLRRTKVALGDPVKRRYPNEARPLVKMSKSLYAARDLSAGTVLTASDIAFKSPGGGVPPYKFDEFIGKRLTRDVKEDEPFAEGDAG